MTDLWSSWAVAQVLRAFFAIEFVVFSGFFAVVGGALFAPCRSRPSRGEPGGSSLSFASPKESNQRKGDPAVCVPSLRCGQPAVLSKSGVTCKLAALKQARALIRFCLRSSAQSEGFWGWIRDRASLIPTFSQREKEQERGFCLAVAAVCKTRSPESAVTLDSPVLAGPVMRQKSGIRAARCLSRRRVCADPRFSGAAQVARRAPDCGSPFFSLGFFGEAKKSKSPAGARPGLLVKGTCLANRKLVSHACKQAQAEAQT